jgi:NAD(P)H-hydrate epimerase
LGLIFEAKLTSAMTLALPESLPGQFSSEATSVLYDFMENCQALALGPGLGLEVETQKLVSELAKNMTKPMVLDADALSLLSGRLDLLKGACGPRVLTPHPGEAGRLLGRSAAQIQADRPGAIRELAKKTGAVIVLKGRHTLISDQEGFLLVNLSGGPVLATGGSGDLLTGLIAGLIAQGYKPFGAAALAVHLHGLAADLAASKLTDRGIFPSEFQACLPEAWKSLMALGKDLA